MNGVPNTLDSVLARVRPTEFGCWEWLGPHQSAGYAKSNVKGRAILVHRYLYEALIGPIAPGFESDHLCRHRWCVNPLHIEPVTRRENILRGAGHLTLARYWLARTHCPAGHPYDAKNTYLHRGRYRKCRACLRANQLRHQEKEQRHAGSRTGG